VLILYLTRPARPVREPNLVPPLLGDNLSLHVSSSVVGGVPPVVGWLTRRHRECDLLTHLRPRVERLLHFARDIRNRPVQLVLRDVPHHGIVNRGAEPA